MTKYTIMIKTLLFAVLLLPILASAQLVEHASMNKPGSSPAPSLTIVGGTPNLALSAFTAAQGSASASQSWTFSGANLQGNVTWPAGSGMEISLDNSTFASSVVITQSGGVITSQVVYTRIAAATSSGTYSGNMQPSSTNLSSPPYVSYSATVSSVLTAQFNFSSTSSSVAGWTNVFGDPTLSPTFTDAGTGWTIQMVPSGSQWGKFSGFYGGVGNGATGASTDGVFSQASVNSNLYSYAYNFNSTGYNMQFTNLPAGTYAIEFIGSIPTGTFNNGGPSEFHVQFGTGSDNWTSYSPNSNVSAPLGQGPGTTNVGHGSFTGTITSGQKINIAVCNDINGLGALGFINALVIRKIS